MNNNVTPPSAWRPEYITDTAPAGESNASGVSWAAIIAGAFVAAALAMILLILGVGLGLSSISPWTGAGIAAGNLGGATIAWLFATNGIASGLGGYLAGRLRVRWASLHTDEVYFRDTAHGFLVWAVASVITAAFLGSVATSIVAGTAELAATSASAIGAAGSTAASMAADASSGAATGASAPTSDAASSAAGGAPSAWVASTPYLTDQLLRIDRPADSSSSTAPGSSTSGTSGNAAANAGSRAELSRMLAESMRRGSLPDADRAYAARVVAAQTGLSQADAEKRVDAVYAQAKRTVNDAELAARSAADNARRALAKTSLWLFVTLLFGAFCASIAATLGGRQRDAVVRLREPALRTRESATYAS